MEFSKRYQCKVVFLVPFLKDLKLPHKVLYMFFTVAS